MQLRQFCALYTFLAIVLHAVKKLKLDVDAFWVDFAN